MVNVTEAIQTRYSTRAFLDKPVERSLLESIVTKALQSPSGGNIQPWHVHVIRGDSMAAFKACIDKEVADQSKGESPEYLVYPPKLKEPYRSRRYKCGEDLYLSIGIDRDNKSARLRQFANNYRFFGAPAAFMFTIDRVMNQPQFSDLGMFIMNTMLLAREVGLDTCGQESWAVWHRVISNFLKLPPEHMVFCGLAIGYADKSHPINGWRTERVLPGEVVTWHE